VYKISSIGEQVKAVKRVILLFSILFCFLVSTTINAQIVNGFGIKSGVTSASHTWSYHTYDTQTTPDFLTGISARAFADFLNIPFFNIEAEIGFSQKGAKLRYQYWRSQYNPLGFYDDIKTDEFRTVNNRLNYINVSLMGKIKYEFGMVTPYLLMGPQFNYLVGKDIEGNDSEVIQSRRRDDYTAFSYTIFPLKDVYNRLYKDIWGFSAGLGSLIRTHNINFLVEYRFERDITYNYCETPEFRNYSHSLLIGIQF
jgi:hypothetical protein